MGEIFPDGHSEIAYTCLQYMCFNDDQHKIDSLEPELAQHIKDGCQARFCLLDYATNNFRHHLRDQSGCTANIIHGFFPDRINLNCISTGFHSQFLSPFYRWHERKMCPEHEYIATRQIHLCLQFAISCGLENVFISLLDASGQSIDHNTRLGGSTMLL
jgi:hypothetical protein